MDIRFSRHVKRRMALYNIDEGDVAVVIEKGEKQVLPDGKLSFMLKINDKFKYPLKVVAVKELEFLKIVTAYPLKKAR